MDYEKFIIDSINMLSGRYTPYQVFTDWITMAAISIQNGCTVIHNKVYKEREDIYLNIINKYKSDEIKTMCDMLGALTEIMEDRFGDILGDIYMKSGCGSKNTGQFFTPYHISYLLAKMTYEEKICKFKENEMIEINEPSTGGGSSIIAFVQVLKENNINYQKRLHVVAQDLDWNGVYMTYIQLSLLGVKAIVVQGDTLCEAYHKGYEERRILRTPAEMGMIF